VNDGSSNTTVQGDGGFIATHWTTVLAAGMDGSPQADQALEKLCRVYWYPLYAYVRRRGYSSSCAEDLTQSFFCSLLQRRSLRQVAKEKGRFRSFLLAALHNFLADEWDKMRALKRGGGQAFLSLDAEEGEGKYRFEPADPVSPDELYDRRWALTVLDAALNKLRQEHAAEPRRFEILQRFLSEVPSEDDYARVALELNSTPGAVRVAVHRLRGTYRDLVRKEISTTVTSLLEVEDELRWLVQVIVQ
jgi:RNA polymerase sigma factor (sigma-70 family)